MESPQDSTVTVTRASHNKSRSGCLTCKRRHVKCDEVRPSCQRCVRAGKTCLGYEDSSDQSERARRKNFKIIHYARAPASTKLTRAPTPHLDEHLLQFFGTKTLPVLMLTSSDNVWSECRLDRLLSNIALKNIATAVALHHLTFEENGPWKSYLGMSAEYISSYSRALKGAQDLLKSHSNADHSVVVACLLLIVLESLRANDAAFKTHLVGGLKMLKAAQDRFPSQLQRPLTSVFAPLWTGAMIKVPFSKDANLITQLESLKISEEVFDLATVDEHNVSAMIHDVQLKTYAFLRTTDAWRPEKPAPDLEAREWLLQRIAHLEMYFATFFKPSHPFSLLRQNAMRSEIEMCKLYLHACLEGTQTAFDKQEHSFRRILTWIRVGLASNSGLLPDHKNSTPDAFSWNLSLIPVLHLCAQMCRNYDLRREALQLLEQCPRREGVWDASFMRHVDQIVIDFEEKGANNWDDQGRCIFIPEENRVHTISAKYSVDRIEFPVLQMLHRPNGPASEWVITEQVLGQHY